jgi:lipoprotein-releasing system ATP-binding protein
MSEVLRLENVTRRYREGEGQLEVFSGLNLSLNAGEIVALVGPSGAGKSSLLHIAGLLEAPTSGDIFIEGVAASRLPDAQRTAIRRDRVGFVYQAHHLLPEFDALENVAIPQMIAGRSKAAARAEGERLLTVLGLGKRLTHRPSQLRAASSSVSPSPAPWPTGRASCWRTSPRATWTRAPRAGCSTP